MNTRQLVGHFFGNSVRGRPALCVAAATTIILACVAGIAVVIVRHSQVLRLDQGVIHASTLLISTLSDETVWSRESVASDQKLLVTARAISRVHDEIVLARLPFARSAQRAALGYTDYVYRLEMQLRRASASRYLARQSVLGYEGSVAALKNSNMRTRVKAQHAATEATNRARQDTESAFQECAQLQRLVREFGIWQAHTLSYLPTVGPDVGAALNSMRPALEEAIQETQDARKNFNPMARSLVSQGILPRRIAYG